MLRRLAAQAAQAAPPTDFATGSLRLVSRARQAGSGLLPAAPRRLNGAAARTRAEPEAGPLRAPPCPQARAGKTLGAAGLKAALLDPSAAVELVGAGAAGQVYSVLLPGEPASALAVKLTPAERTAQFRKEAVGHSRTGGRQVPGMVQVVAVVTEPVVITEQEVRRGRELRGGQLWCRGRAGTGPGAARPGLPAGRALSGAASAGRVLPQARPDPQMQPLPCCPRRRRRCRGASKPSAACPSTPRPGW